MASFRLIKAQRTGFSNIILWGKDEFGKYPFEIDDFQPYFFVSADQELNDAAIVSNEWGYESVIGESLRKVIVTGPGEVPRLRDGVTKHWEADIPFARRFLIDKGIRNGFDDNLNPCSSPNVPISVVSLDIEVYSKDQMPDPQKDSVTCWTLVEGDQIVTGLLDDVDFQSEEGKTCILRYDSEEKLIRCLQALLCVRNWDCLTGWNVSWDLEYLQARSDANNILFSFKYDLSGTCIFDLLTAYRRLYRRKGYRLKDIVQDEGIADFDEEKVNYAELWEQDKLALVERNRRHANWVYQIDQKNKIIEYHWSLKDFCGLEELEDTEYNSVLIDTLFLRRTHNKFVLPSKERREHEDYEGAFIMQPQAGVFKNVAVFDLSMFYPNILLSNKLDPVVLLNYKKEMGDQIDWLAYSLYVEMNEEKCILIDLVKEMIEQRNKFKSSEIHKAKYASVKGLLNSVYGVLGHATFRLYVPEIAARITEIARETIKTLGKQIESWGYKVIYQDTDSSFVCVDKGEAEWLQTKINDYLTTHGGYQVKLDHYFDAVMFAGIKKKYCGLENGVIHTTGFEKVRSDASNFTKEIQEKVIEMMLTDKAKDIIPYLQMKIKDIRSCKLADISVSKSLSRDLDGYTKQQQSYILSAKQAGLDLKRGDSVKIVHARNYPYGVAVFVDEKDLPKPVEVDWEAIIEKQIQNKVDELLPIAGLSFSEITGQKRLL